MTNYLLSEVEVLKQIKEKYENKKRNEKIST